MALEGFSIDELKSNISAAGAQWQAGETRFTQMSGSERSVYLGYVPGPGEAALEERERIAQANLEGFRAAVSAGGYPAAYDLRNVGGKSYITDVKDQGGCGSCVAFGVAATAEGRMRRQRNNPDLPVNYSEAHLFFCNSRQCNSGDPRYGWWTGPALDYFRDTGVVDDACYAYQAVNQACQPCSNWSSRVTKITGWKRLTSLSEMKEWIATRGPLVACYTVYDDFFGYREGIYRHVTGGVAGGHCVSVVGYNDTEQYWICKNSWGDDFGEEGYFRIAYGQCGIDSSMDTVDGLAETGWERNHKVTSLWAINEDRNAWAHFTTLGWRKISRENDNIFFDMLAQLIAAKAGARRVDFYQDNGVIKQIYVF